MAKFHINKAGVPAPCRAFYQPCPLGGPESHYDSKEAAQAAADAHNQEKYGGIPTRKQFTARDLKSAGISRKEGVIPEFYDYNDAYQERSSYVKHQAYFYKDMPVGYFTEDKMVYLTVKPARRNGVEEEDFSDMPEAKLLDKYNGVPADSIDPKELEADMSTIYDALEKRSLVGPNSPWYDPDEPSIRG